MAVVRSRAIRMSQLPPIGHLHHPVVRPGMHQHERGRGSRFNRLDDGNSRSAYVALVAFDTSTGMSERTVPPWTTRANHPRRPWRVRRKAGPRLVPIYGRP